MSHFLCSVQSHGNLVLEILGLTSGCPRCICTANENLKHLSGEDIIRCAKTADLFLTTPLPVLI